MIHKGSGYLEVLEKKGFVYSSFHWIIEDSVLFSPAQENPIFINCFRYFNDCYLPSNCWRRIIVAVKKIFILAYFAAMREFR